MAAFGQDSSHQPGRFRHGPFDPDAENRPPKPRFPYDGTLRTATLTVDGKTLVALDVDGRVVGWDVATTRRLYRLPLVDKDEVAQSLTASPDGRFVALSPRSLPAGIVRVLDARTGKELRRFDRGFAPSFSPDSKLVACSDGKRLRRWALNGGAELPSFPEAEAALKWTAWSPTGDVIAASAEDSTLVAVWDAATGRRFLRDLVASDAEGAASLAFTPDGKVLAVGSHWGIRFFWISGPPEREYRAHEEYAVGPLRFSADGKRMVALSRRRRLLVWDASTGKPLFTWASFQLEEGNLEISGGSDVAIWIERGGIRLERIPLLLGGPEEGHRARNLCFTPTGNVVTGDDQGALCVWDPATQKQLRRMAVPLLRMRYFSRDGAWAVFGGAGDPVGIWDLEAGKEILKVEVTPAVQSIALSPDDRRMALGHADGSITLWSIPDRKELTRIRTELAQVTAISWSRDGKSLAFGDHLGSVMIAEGEQGREPMSFRTRGGSAIQELQFSEDGRSVIATEASGIHRVYSDPGVEPRVVSRASSIVPGRGPDDRWTASGSSQERHLEIVRQAISQDGQFIAGLTSGGKLVIWQAPGAK